MQSIDNLFNCECCGGRLIEIENKKYKCDHCGQIRYIETTASIQIISMLNQANILRNKGEFDDAFDIFNDILSIESENADAYWGMFLSTFGVMHVLDPRTNTYVPTCNRCTECSALEDSNYKKSLQLANTNQAQLFTQTASTIEKIRSSYIKNSKNEKPYDIFICYKRTLSVINGREVYTEDSVCARDIYDILTAKGYKVFFAEKSLQNLAGSEYEPIIYNALKTSKIMLVISSETELINAPWVKNEWLRFIKQMEYDSSKKLIPILFNGMKATSLPDKLKKFQGLEINPHFQTNLLNAVEHSIKSEQIIPPPKPHISFNNENLNKTNRLLEESAVNSSSLSILDTYLNTYTAEKIIIPDSVTDITLGAFSGKKSLKSIVIPNSVTCIGSLVFNECTSLEHITIPNSVTKLGCKAFKSCINLKTITFENNSNLKKLEYKVFSECESLENIIIPNSVTTIESCAFEDCISLKSVVIPHSVNCIEHNIFSNCKNLKHIYYCGNKNDYKKINKGFNNDELERATIYYSATEPVEKGNFWRYIDGKIVVWE